MSNSISGAELRGPAAGTIAGVYSLLIVAMLLGGVNFVVIRIMLAYLSPLAIAEARFAGSSLLLLLLIFLVPGHRTPIRLGDIPIILAMAATGFAISTTLLNYGLLYSSAGESAIIVGTSPVITALFASLWLKERLTVARLVGLALAFGGVTTVVLAREGLSSSGDHMLGYLASLGTAISLSFFSVIGKVALRRFTPLAAVTYSITAAALMLIPMVSLVDGWRPFLAAPVEVWEGIAFAVVCATVYGNVVWYNAIKHIGASRTAVFNNAITVAAVFSGAVILHEPITVFHLIGLVLVIAGIVLATRTSSRVATRSASEACATK